MPDSASAAIGEHPVEKGGVLFLDIALKTGWVYGTLTNLKDGPIWGVWQLPTLPALGRRLVAFENELADAIWQFQPAVVGIEAPMPAGRGVGSAHTAELLLCLSGAAEAVCFRWDRMFTRRAVGTLRSSVCGRCQVNSAEADDRMNVKDAIVRPWLARIGWHIPENNAADAAVGWAYEMGVRAPPPPKPRRVAPLLQIAGGVQ